MTCMLQYLETMPCQPTIMTNVKNTAIKYTYENNTTDKYLQQLQDVSHGYDLTNEDQK